jgi:hypothetical protein
MNEWKCTVKTPSNYLQDVYVEAYTRSDAVAAAENSTGGKCISANPQYNNSSTSSDDNDNSESSIDAGFIFLILIIVFIVYAWKWILLIGGLSALIWILIKFYRD